MAKGLAGALSGAMESGASAVDVCVLPTLSTVKTMEAQMAQLVRDTDALPYQSPEWKASTARQQVLRTEISKAKRIAKEQLAKSRTFGAEFDHLKSAGLNVKVPTVLGQQREKIVELTLKDAVEGERMLAARGIKIPRGTGIKYDNFAAQGQDSAFAHVGHDKKIGYNLKSPRWTNEESAAKMAQRNLDSGWLSDKNVFVHEMGHVLHVKRQSSFIVDSLAWTGAETKPALSAIARQVSRYAATSDVEFVAETFSGLVNGRKYSSEVMDLYAKVGGPPVPGLKR